MGEHDTERTSSGTTSGPTSGDLSLRRFLGTWWRETLGVDGRLWRTLWLDLLRPGSHAQRHLEGKGRDLIPPVRFYLIVNLAFFLLVPLFNSESFTVWSFTLDSLSGLPPASTAAVAREVAEWPGGEAVYRAAFDERVSSNQAVYLFLVIPMVAMPLWLLLRRRRRFLAQHLLHATGLLTFGLLTMFVLGLGVLAVRLMVPLGLERAHASFVVQGVLLQLWTLALLVGFEGASRRFYGLRWWASLPLGVLTSILMLLAGWIYGKLLFWFTLLTL